MNDLEIAKKKMYKDELNFVLVNNGKILLSSAKSGIVPIYELYNQSSEIYEGCSISDRVIGNAAARLLVELKVSKVFGELMSQKAIETLESYQIEVSYKNKVENILNRTKNDLCPMEKLSLASASVSNLNNHIKQFLEVQK